MNLVQETKKIKNNLIRLSVVKGSCPNCKFRDHILADPESAISLAAARDVLVARHDHGNRCPHRVSFDGGFGIS